MRNAKLLVTAGLALAVGTLLGCGQLSSSAGESVAGSSFPTQLSPALPGDVNPNLLREFKDKGDKAAMQRLFDTFSWQSFIAVNWPADAQGNPDPNKKPGAPGPVVWEFYKEAYDVFKENGEAPSPWGTPRRLPPACEALGAGKANHLLRRTFKQINDEFIQAFTAPLTDQNGNWARYEVLMNKSEFDFINANQLYNINGQAAFSQKHGLDKIDYAKQSHSPPAFPIGVFSGDAGAVELKAAWRVMTPNDDANRYFVIDSYVYTEPDGVNQASCKLEKVGLVGFHISHKTQSSAQWVWSTFEHVDNLSVRDGGKFNGKPIKPSFYNPDCETCPVNVAPPGPPFKADEPHLPVQAKRMIPIPQDTAQLNREVQALLKGTVWQYYELIGTQFPTSPETPPTPGGQCTAPDSVTNKPGGKPNYAFLTNITMETFFQTGNQPAANLEEGGVYDNTQIFGTESCMGCHSSAPIALAVKKDNCGNDVAVWGSQLSGDFSWLLNQRGNHFLGGTPPKQCSPPQSPPPAKPTPTPTPCPPFKQARQ